MVIHHPACRFLGGQLGVSIPNYLAYEAGAEGLPLWEEIWPGSFKDASSTLSPSWMSMARLAFPSRLELNRPEWSFNAAPLANVFLSAFFCVSPVQTMPP